MNIIKKLLAFGLIIAGVVGLALLALCYPLKVCAVMVLVVLTFAGDQSESEKPVSRIVYDKDGNIVKAKG